MLDSGCRFWSPPPSGLRSRLVPGRTPRTLVAPRAGQISCGLLHPGRGADSPPTPPRGTLGRTRLAVAPRPSSRLQLLLASTNSALRDRVFLTLLRPLL